jgi:hypothetical protein
MLQALGRSAAMRGMIPKVEAAVASQRGSMASLAGMKGEWKPWG